MRRLRSSPTLDAHVALSFLPIFAISLTFFVLLLEMGDLFVNIVQYVQNETPFALIAKSMILYLPRCVSWALPIATLFSVSYTLGGMYANNELIVVFGSGISLASFVAPLLAISLVLSAGFLVFDDAVVIPSLSEKKALTKAMLKTGEPAGAADVTILGQGRRIVWNVRYFDRKNTMLTGVTLVERDDGGRIASRVNAQSAVWTGTAWRFSGVRRFFWKDGAMTDESLGTWEDPAFAEPPESFKGGGKPIEELRLSDAAEHIAFLERAGLPRAAQTAEYYRRFAFALTPLVVTLLSAALVGRYKKNVLLMSLLISLVAATLYYVTQMVTMLLAKNGSVSPAAGAFTPIIIFSALVLALFKARPA
ncbi:MAG TPA: LptF/LptG family permease [Spirochaetales bacterium]|nr:LptF/LptG family permease [Spirochaetales bacterium]HPG86541.1 LptF/LptG family permease [Spirochaetales bacterium]HPM71844.1 LptF/LptG family permease [Spirochaetales bacterium]